MFSHGNSSSRGVAIIVQNKSNVVINKIYRDESGRILILDLTKDECSFSLVNVYAPNIEHLQSLFYSDLTKLFLEKIFTEKDNVIVTGDFNCVLNAKLDKKGGLEKTKDIFGDIKIQKSIGIHGGKVTH